MDVSFVQNTKNESVCTKLMISQVDIREGFTKKVARLLDFVQMRGREGPAQNFCHLFISAFLVNKRSIFPPK